MKYKNFITVFVLLLIIVISMTSCTNSTKQNNKDMDLAGFVFKIPSGFSVGKTESNYLEEQATIWKHDSIILSFDVWKKENKKLF